MLVARESVHPACSSPALDCQWGTHACDHRSASEPAAASGSGQRNAIYAPVEGGGPRRWASGPSLQTTATGFQGPRARDPAWKRKNDKNCFCSHPQPHTTHPRSPLRSYARKSPLLRPQSAAAWHRSVAPWPSSETPLLILYYMVQNTMKVSRCQGFTSVCLSPTLKYLTVL